MALGLQRTQIELKKTGTTVSVPNNPWARLMYYFNCVCSCVDVDNDSELRKLRNYSNYYNLTSDEKGALLGLCLAVSPDKLIGVLFFHSDNIDSGNEFYELSAVRTKMVVSESFLVGGQEKKVQSIMMFKKVWMDTYYIQPLRDIQREIRPRPVRSGCVVS